MAPISWHIHLSDLFISNPTNAEKHCDAFFVGIHITVGIVQTLIPTKSLLRTAVMRHALKAVFSIGYMKWQVSSVVNLLDTVLTCWLYNCSAELDSMGLKVSVMCTSEMIFGN